MSLFIKCEYTKQAFEFAHTYNKYDVLNLLMNSTLYIFMFYYEIKLDQHVLDQSLHNRFIIVILTSDLVLHACLGFFCMFFSISVCIRKVILI